MLIDHISDILTNLVEKCIGHLNEGVRAKTESLILQLFEFTYTNEGLPRFIDILLTLFKSKTLKT